MNKERAKARNKLKDISSVSDFNSLLENLMLSDEEIKLMKMHYKDKKTLSYIADELGMSEANVKKKHSKILNKICSMH